MPTTHEIFYELYRSRYGREAVCSTREMDAILQGTHDHDAVLEAMLARVGTPSTEALDQAQVGE
jgi:hypothetical protein